MALTLPAPRPLWQPTMLGKVMLCMAAVCEGELHQSTNVAHLY